jgi:hypothetical protein
MIAHGWDDVFLDLDPERGLKAGERWQDRGSPSSFRTRHGMGVSNLPACLLGLPAGLVACALLS